MQGRAKASKDVQVLDDIWHDLRRRRLFKSATKHLSGKQKTYCYIGQNIFARTSHDSYVFKFSSFHRRVFQALDRKLWALWTPLFPSHCSKSIKSINEYLPNMATPLAKKTQFKIMPSLMRSIGCVLMCFLNFFNAKFQVADQSLHGRYLGRIVFHAWTSLFRVL